MLPYSLKTNINLSKCLKADGEGKNGFLTYKREIMTFKSQKFTSNQGKNEKYQQIKL